MNQTVKEHWDKVYSRTDDNKTGWYEESPVPAVELLMECSLNNNDRILIVGAGTTSFVNYLVEQNYIILLLMI